MKNISESIARNIKDKENEITNLTSTLKQNAFDSLISDITSNGPTLLKQLVDANPTMSIRVVKEYNSSEQEAPYAIFFALDFNEHTLYFYTDDQTCDYEADGYQSGSVMSEASCFMDFVNEHNLLAGNVVSLEDSENAFDYITQMADDLKFENTEAYYKFIVEDEGAPVF